MGESPEASDLALAARIAGRGHLTILAPVGLLGLDQVVGEELLPVVRSATLIATGETVEHLSLRDLMGRRP